MLYRFDFDPKPVLDRTRAAVKVALPRLQLDAADDMDELPVAFAEKSRVTSLCGCYQHLASNGLGRVTVYPRQCRSPEKLEATLLHEFAHAVVHWMDPQGRETQDHGKLWQYVMLTLGQEPSKYVVGECSVERSPEQVYAKK